MGGHLRFAFRALAIIVAVLCFGIGGASASDAETAQVVVGVAQDFYPEYALDGEGRAEGFAIDMMNAVAKRAGLNVTYRVFETWTELITTLEQGETDVIPVVAVTRARERRMLFTRPVVTSSVSLFVREDADMRGWTDFAMRRAAVIGGGFSAELLGERYPTARLLPYAHLKHALFDMLSGEVDALVSFESAVWKVAERARVADRIKVIGGAMAESHRAIAVRKSLPGLRDRLDAAVAEFLSSSEYSRLYAKWYATPPSFWSTGRVGWLAGVSTALMLLGMLVWQALSLHAESRRPAESAAATLTEASAAVARVGQKIPRACGLVGVALGIAVLMGWTFEVPLLKSVLPGAFPMQPWAATGIVLAGGSLVLATMTRSPVMVAGNVLAGAVLLIGLQMLQQHVAGAEVGIDRWLFPRDVDNQSGLPHPGRLAPVTSLAFACLGAILLLAKVERRWSWAVSSTLGTVGLLLMATIPVGYLIGGGALRSVAFVTPVAIHAAVGLGILFVGTLALRPNIGWVALLSGDRPGAVWARMLLPVTIIGPLLLAWLFAVGARAGLYGPEFQVGLATLATVALLVTSLLWSGVRVDRLDRVRQAGVEALRESERRYRTLVEGQPDPICQFLPDTTLTFVNHAYAEFYGRSPAELIGTRWLDFAAADQRPPFLDKLASFTPEHPERREETASTRADHQVRWYLWHIYGFFDDAGRIISFQTFSTDITERKLAEEQSSRQFALLSAITDSAADAIFVSDGEERITLLNSAAERIFGWSREELLGRKLHDATHDRYPDGRPFPASECPLSRVYATGETLVGREDVFFRKDGSAVPVACSSAPLKIEGRIAGAVLTAHDITKRKQAEKALQASEARLRLFIETAPVAIAMFDRNMRYLAASGRFCSDYRLDASNLVGRSHYEVFPDMPDRWREVHRRCLEGAVECSDGERFDHADGNVDWVRWEIQPWCTGDGQIGGLTLFSEDISDRRRTEQALRENEAQLRATFENAAVGISNIGGDGSWLRVNQRLCEIVGYSREELLQKKFHEMTHPDDLPSNLQRFNALMRGEIDSYQQEMRYLHKCGHTIWVNLTSALQRDAAGNPACCISIIEDINVRKAAERALHESETRLRRTVEQAPFPIMVHAEDGKVVHLSQSWLDLSGYDRSAINTIADWTKLAYGECEVAVRAEIDQLYALEGPVDEGEYVIRTAGGGLRVWTFSSAPLGRDGRGRRLVVSMASDVTARKEVERALTESENRMRALLDASQDEILLLGIEGNVLAINRAAERRLARRANPADLIGARLDRLLPRDQAESRLATAREVATTRTAQHCEVPTRSRWFEFWYYPVVQLDKPVTEVAVYAREITTQKKLLADLSKLFQAVDQSPMSVIITDRDGNIEYVNPEFTKVTGYTSEEAIGRNPRILKSGRTPPEVYEELWRTISAGGVWRGEFLNRKKNGELYWELASIAAVKGGERITNFVAVKEDITARREMEEQLRHSQKMQAVGQLTGGIAHDFNNLLAIVIGNLQLLRERLGSGDAKVREYLDDALWSARRGGELTHRLLAFARKQPLKPAVIDINEVVRGMSELLRRTLGARIQIEEALAADVWQSVADRGELERAIVNLAVNARDAMPTGGTLSLETRNALLDADYCEQYEEVTPGEYVLLAVTDTGGGMSPEIIGRVFEPFFTTKETGQGSGLGLSMVYGFVKQSGGHISIYSRVGQGTSVKLYLPRVPVSPERREEQTPDVLAAELGDSVVLVVEDEPRLRKVAVKMLERLGLRSMQAENAKDALDLLAATRPDVVFTDIELPDGMSGTDLADAVHELDPTIKVLFTTGYAREAVLHERWREEKVPWLLKPYSHLDLARELRALLSPTVH